jgi:exonuclease VII large subunit
MKQTFNQSPPVTDISMCNDMEKFFREQESSLKSKLRNLENEMNTMTITLNEAKKNLPVYKEEVTRMQNAILSITEPALKSQIQENLNQMRIKLNTCQEQIKDNSMVNILIKQYEVVQAQLSIELGKDYLSSIHEWRLAFNHPNKDKESVDESLRAQSQKKIFKDLSKVFMMDLMMHDIDPSASSDYI